MQNIMNFEMMHQMGVYAASIYFPATKNRHLFDQKLVVPFDTYVLNAFVDPATNRSVPIIRGKGLSWSMWSLEL